MTEQELVHSSHDTTIEFEVIYWRCVNGHLIARMVIDQTRKRMAIEIKCHRCKHVEKKEMRSIEQ